MRGETLVLITMKFWKVFVTDMNIFSWIKQQFGVEDSHKMLWKYESGKYKIKGQC